MSDNHWNFGASHSGIEPPIKNEAAIDGLSIDHYFNCYPKRRVAYAVASEVLIHWLIILLIQIYQKVPQLAERVLGEPSSGPSHLYTPRPQAHVVPYHMTLSDQAFLQREPSIIYPTTDNDGDDRSDTTLVDSRGRLNLHAASFGGHSTFAAIDHLHGTIEDGLDPSITEGLDFALLDSGNNRPADEGVHETHVEEAAHVWREEREKIPSRPVNTALKRSRARTLAHRDASPIMRQHKPDEVNHFELESRNTLNFWY